MHVRVRSGLMLAFAISTSSANAAIDLDWLAGSWCAGEQPYTTEEHWLPQRGGLMLGMSRTITKRGTEFEFVRIEFDNAGAKYIAQPSGGPATVFTLVTSGPNTATFANPRHDFPKRIRYVRDGEKLTAIIDDGQNEASARDFGWQRCKQ